MQTVFSQYGDPHDTTTPSFARPSKPRRRRDVPACAECRRLKLKCDRASPCGTCVRRGCAAICPGGSMVAAKGGRFVLAGMEGFVARIDALCERVRALEVALESESATGAGHPLLSADLRSLADKPLDDEPTPPLPSSSRKDPSDEDVRELLELAATFPQPLEEDELLDAERTISDIRSLLPSQDEARTLTQSFYDGFGTTLSAVTRPAFERMLAQVYGGPTRTDLEGVHILALVFLAFALARFRDDADSETFFYLSKALYCIRTCVESTSDVSIHGLLLMTTYCRLTGRTSATWTTFGIIGKLIIANNLHRDPARWGIDGPRAAYWRATFWEIYSIETLYTMTVQRVPTFHPAYIDCPMPDLELDSPDPVTRVNAHFYSWKYRFAGEILPRVLQDTLGRTQPTYNTILDLDKLVRSSWVPDCLQPDRSNPIDEGDSPAMAMQRFIILWYRELTLLFLHRTPLAIALTETVVAGVGEEEFGHRFAPSVLAAFRSAHKLTSALRALAAPSLSGPSGNKGMRAQHVCFWQAGFVATTVLASLALRVPATTLGRAAREEALRVVALYETRMVHVPQKILAWLSSFKSKLLGVHSDVDEHGMQGTPEWDQFGADEVPFGGRTRVSGRLALKTAQIPNTDRDTNLHLIAPSGSTLRVEPPGAPGLFQATDASAFAFDTQGPIPINPPGLAEPIAFDYFPPHSQPGPVMPESQIVDWADEQSYSASLAGSSANAAGDVNGGVASGEFEPALREAEMTSQWERFLHSIGLCAEGEGMGSGHAL